MKKPEIQCENQTKLSSGHQSFHPASVFFGIPVIANANQKDPLRYSALRTCFLREPYCIVFIFNLRKGHTAANIDTYEIRDDSGSDSHGKPDGSHLTGMNIRHDTNAASGVLFC